MAQQITFTYKGKDYVLEFTRRTIAEMERQGFEVEALTNKPITMIPALFQGSFLAHHRYAKKEVIDDIFSHMKNKEELFQKLISMYQEPFVSMLEEPEESEGNVDWTGNS